MVDCYIHEHYLSYLTVEELNNEVLSIFQFIVLENYRVISVVLEKTLCMFNCLDYMNPWVNIVTIGPSHETYHI